AIVRDEDFPTQTRRSLLREQGLERLAESGGAVVRGDEHGDREGALRSGAGLHGFGVGNFGPGAVRSYSRSSGRRRRSARTTRRWRASTTRFAARLPRRQPRIFIIFSATHSVASSRSWVSHRSWSPLHQSSAARSHRSPRQRRLTPFHAPLPRRRE